MSADAVEEVGVLEPAASGRAKCRACRRTIAKGELRFGERAPNPFGDGDATFWFHLRCAAAKRPKAVTTVLASPELAERYPAELAEVRETVELGLTHERLSWHAGASRAPSGRARCRSCRELIEKSAWRVALDIWEEGRFAPMGFVHAGCAQTHFGGDASLGDRVTHFSSALSEVELTSFREALALQRPVVTRPEPENNSPPGSEPDA